MFKKLQTASKLSTTKNGWPFCLFPLLLNIRILGSLEALSIANILLAFLHQLAE